MTDRRTASSGNEGVQIGPAYGLKTSQEFVLAVMVWGKSILGVCMHLAAWAQLVKVVFFANLSDERGNQS